MALTELIFQVSKMAVGAVEFDCSVSETHVDEAEITDHPVEGGADMTDHIRKLPVSLELNGLITNTPVAIMASLTGGSPVTTDVLPFVLDRVEAGYAELRRTMDEGERLDVSTSLRSYENMAIKNLVVSRDVSNGNVLNCKIGLREIIEAKALSIDLPTPQDVGNNSKKNKGKKGKQDGTTKQGEKSQSILSSLVG